MNSQTLDAIETARRILAALADKRNPDRADIDKLRWLAPPLAHMLPEELATEVIQLAAMISGAHLDPPKRWLDPRTRKATQAPP